MARHPLLSAGPACPQERHRRSTYCCCGKAGKATAAGLVLDTCTCWFVLVCHLSPTLGLAWRGRRRGAQLDEELLSTPLAADFGPGPEAEGRTAGLRYFFPLGLLSTPLAADFGPGPEAAAEGRATGRGLRFLRLSPLTSGQAGMGRRGARSWTRSLLLMPLTANFGPGLDGAVKGCSDVCLSIFHSLASRRGGKGVRWRLPFYLSLTGLSTGGQAMLGHWSQHHLRL